MKYLMLIYTNEESNPQPVETGKMLAAYRQFTDDVIARGMMQGGEALLPSSTATTVRVRDGERLVSDGPFAESKEQLGGYYLLDCRDLDEAIEYASGIPGAKHGAIEVRPVRVFA